MGVTERAGVSCETVLHVLLNLVLNISLTVLCTVTSVPRIATNVIYRHIQDVQILLYVRVAAKEAYYGHLRTASYTACKSEIHNAARNKIYAVHHE